MMRRARYACLVLTVVATGCASLRGAPAPPLPFLERSYVFSTRGDTTLLYEAQAASHILLTDGLPGAYDALSSDASVRTAGAWRVIATPMFRIRQLSDSSAAVRTPSFMPRLSVERLWARRVDAATGADPTMPMFGRVLLAGARLTLAHHSNGQAGCFRDGFVPEDSRANRCLPAPGADTNIVALNRANGDFSSTFVNLTAHATWMNRDGAGIGTRSIGLAVGGDYHPPGIFGALSDEQRELYGGWRLRLQLEGKLTSGVTCDDDANKTTARKLACALKGRSRATFEGERAPKEPGDLARRIQPAVVPYRVSFELSHAFDALLGAGAFIRWHDGQDYYNIGFVHRRRVFVFGGMLDVSGLDRITKQITQ